MPFWPQMPSSWLSSGYNLSQLFMAANPQGSAYFHSPLHHYKSDPLSLDSKHVLVSSLGFGPPQSNTILLLLVFCPSGRQEQEKRQNVKNEMWKRRVCVNSKPLFKIVCSVPQEQVLEMEITFFFYKPHVWSPSMMPENPFHVFTVLLLLFF